VGEDTSSSPRPDGPDRGGRASAAWVALAAVILLTSAIRVRLLDVPFERDEGEYAYAGQLLLEGVPPFRLAYNMKLPGTYAAYALALALFGETGRGARVGLMLVNAATIVLVFALGRKLLGIGGGLCAAASFAFLSLSISMLGPFGHATHFVALMAVAGTLVFVSALESRRRSLHLASGALLGLAFLMKQPGFVFPLFAVTWLFGERLRQPEGRATIAGEAVALIAGMAAPVAAMLGWLAASGVMDRFYFWVIEYARSYASSVGLSDGLRYLARTGSQIASEHLLLLLVAAAGIAMQAIPRAAARTRGFLLAFLGFSLLGVCPGLYFRGHYFLLALPAVSLLVGGAYRGAVALAGDASARACAARWTAAAVVGVACVQPAIARAGLYLQAPPARVSREIYGANPFPESLEVARYLRERTGPGDTIAVIGSEPQIYFYAGRRAATGYIYTYALMELQPLARAMQEEMIRQIETARPAYVVFVSVSTSWLARPGSERTILAWADRYLTENYELCGEVAIVDEDRTVYRWERDAAELPPGVQGLMVLRRKGVAPVAPAPSHAARLGP
jgi:hypothetical protein